MAAHHARRSCIPSLCNIVIHLAIVIHLGPIGHVNIKGRSTQRDNRRDSYTNPLASAPQRNTGLVAITSTCTVEPHSQLRKVERAGRMRDEGLYRQRDYGAQWRTTITIKSDPVTVNLSSDTICFKMSERTLSHPCGEGFLMFTPSGCGL